jgi:diguanylate cyclase (GGDEF)-like protein
MNPSSPKMLVLLGAALLIASLFSVRRLTRELPRGAGRNQWRMLGFMIFVISLGYFAYVYGDGDKSSSLHALLVPMVFFLGACVVLIVCSMSIHTVHDVRRIAVLQRESVTDPLMNIFNRRHLDSQIKREITRAHRHGLPLSVLLMDIDYFKSVNDKWGHAVGDDALVALGRLCLDTVRINDIVARYGGEEIAVIAPDTDADATQALAERLRQTIAAAVLIPPDERTEGQGLRLTVSIGAAMLAPEPDSARDLLKRVDVALYRAKEEGRNRVVFQGTHDDVTDGVSV